MLDDFVGLETRASHAPQKRHRAHQSLESCRGASLASSWLDAFRGARNDGVDDNRSQRQLISGLGRTL